MPEPGYTKNMAPAIPQETPKEYRIIQFGGYDWRILEERDDKLFIVTDKVIAHQRYHEPGAAVTWENCALREYLNRRFITGFTEEEQARILPAELENADNPWYEPGKGGNPTTDRVFLLSIGELVRYFGDSGDLAARRGWYWAGAEPDKEDRKYDIHEMLLKDGRGQFLYDRYNTARIAKNRNNEGSWWRLRSPGRENIYTAVVSPIGAVILTGTPHSENGMRPAMWVRAR